VLTAGLGDVVVIVKDTKKYPLRFDKKTARRRDHSRATPAAQKNDDPQGPWESFAEREPTSVPGDPRGFDADRPSLYDYDDSRRKRIEELEAQKQVQID
jgi:hypothetical protein